MAIQKQMKEVLRELSPRPLTAGGIVKAMRHNFRITQDELAQVTGLRRENLSALENDRIEMTVHYAEILGAALGLHPSSLLFPDGEYRMSKEAKEIERKAQALIRKKQAV